MKGRLITVVGDSGAGKDTLLGLVQDRLREDARYRFVRRFITRPAETTRHAGAEDHLPISGTAFREALATGAFALHWEAHGLSYGIPRDIETDLTEGRIVVANLSRTVLEEANRRYPLLVLLVTAPLPLRAARLAARGRESQEEVARRLGRTAPLAAGLEVIEIANDGTPEAGAARLLAALHRASAAAAISRRA